MTQSLRNGTLAGLAALGLLAAGAAYAADSAPTGRMLPPPDDAVISGVTVSVPKVVERTKYGMLTKEIEMSVRVPYGDLNMLTPEGQAELDRRVAEAADYACDSLDRMYPEGTPVERQCRRLAVSEAQPQVILARNPN
jgi:UrcA family protein